MRHARHPVGPMKRPEHLPDFKAPPLAEMVLGIQFAGLGGFQALHLGKLHDDFSDRYPETAQVAPLAPTFEFFGLPKTGTEVSFGLQFGPELPRVWFLTQDKERLIQFQPDRLLLNWRKLKEDSQYPRYEALEDEFREAFNKLCSFLESNKLHPIEINQCEVTYINHIYTVSGKPVSGDAGEILRCWRRECIQEFGDDLENSEVRLRRVIKNESGNPIARMTCEASPQISNSGQIRTSFSLTVRGVPKSPNIESAITFFKMGREQIVLSFTSLTADDLHTDWGRVK